MLLAGSALSALDVLSSLKDLVSSGSKSGTGSGAAFKVSDIAGKAAQAAEATGAGQVSADTMRSLLALQAKSGGGGGLSSQIFAKLDRDGNGRISKTEFDDVVEGLGGSNTGKSDTRSLFDALDSDDDGEVSDSEFTSMLSRQAPKIESIKASSGTQELFQRLLQQQTEMISNLPTGQAVARLI